MDSKRDDWMMGSSEDLSSIVPTTAQRKSKREVQAALDKQRNDWILTTREVSTTQSVSESRSAKQHKPVTDGGASWLHRAYKRAQEQAVAEGRSLEEVAAERWGSLQKLKDMIAAAEGGGPVRGGGKSDMYRNRDSELSTRRRRDDRIPSSRDREDGHERDRKSWRKRGRSRSPIRPHQPSQETFDQGRDKDNRKYTDGNRDSVRVAMSSDKSGVGKSRDEELSSHDPRRACEVEIPMEKDVHAKLVPSKVAAKLGGWTGKDFVRGERPAKTSHVASIVEDETEAEIKTRPLTLDERNKIGSKILKAELMGKLELVGKLKKELESGVKIISAVDDNGGSATGSNPERYRDEVILTTTDARTGYTVPLNLDMDSSKPVAKKRKGPSAEEAFRTVGAEQTLQEMVEEEKRITAEDQNIDFAKMIGKAGTSSIQQLDTQDEVTADDVFMTRKRPNPDKQNESNVRQAIKDHRKRERTLDSCSRCVDSKKCAKHLIVHLGETAYVAVPAAEPLVSGHTVILPLDHIGSCRQCDENCFTEMKEYIRTLSSMWQAKGCDLVVMETAAGMHRLPHCEIHCIPVESSQGELAPMYFQKAILEAEGEWVQNKRLIKFDFEKGVMRSIPKGMPYFSVQFGKSGGFAHVIENERTFPARFGQEILCGILEMDFLQLRGRPQVEFSKQVKRVQNLKSDFENALSK